LLDPARQGQKRGKEAGLCVSRYVFLFCGIALFLLAYIERLLIQRGRIIRQCDEWLPKAPLAPPSIASKGASINVRVFRLRHAGNKNELFLEIVPSAIAEVRVLPPVLML
jgi:hypothetical protein